MAFISDSLSVASISALKALTSSTTPKRTANLFLTVLDNGTGVASWYYYNASSSTTESLPTVVAPTDGVGRWLQYGAVSGNYSNKVILTASTYTVTADNTEIVIMRSDDATIILPPSPAVGCTVQILGDPRLGVIEATPTFTINLNGKTYYRTSTAYSNLYIRPGSSQYGGKLIYTLAGEWGDYPLVNNSFAIS